MRWTTGRLAALAASAILLLAAGCKARVVLGLDHTYGQILATSTGFEVDAEFPFRWSFDDVTLEVELGNGRRFTLEKVDGYGFANHPNPATRRPELADWMGAKVIKAALLVTDPVPLESSRVPADTVALLETIRESGWVPRRPAPDSVDALRRQLDQSKAPAHDTWVFDRDGQSIEVAVSWRPQDSATNRFQRRGVSLNVTLQANVPLSVF